MVPVEFYDYYGAGDVWFIVLQSAFFGIFCALIFLNALYLLHILNWLPRFRNRNPKLPLFIHMVENADGEKVIVEDIKRTAEYHARVHGSAD